jgi:glycosyltransferase involved in cell wall biosynthesis
MYKNIEFHVVISKRTGPGLTGLEDLTNVTLYRDHLDDAEFLEQYQQSDILFLPLLQCTANNALLEGIACGLPVVSTCLPSMKAYLPGKEAILIKDNDPKQFVDAILHLVRNPTDRRNMARAARKRAEELNWRNIAPQYEAIYSKLANTEILHRASGGVDSREKSFPVCGSKFSALHRGNGSPTA